MNVPWPVVATIISALAGIIGSLVLLNLQGIKKCIGGLLSRLDKQDSRIETMQRDMTACKQDCDRNTVSKEDWVREIGYNRKLQEHQIRELAEIKAHMNIIDKLPEIIGQITRNIASELKKG